MCHTVIAVPPVIRGAEEVSPLTVIEGGLITLVCESSGIPPPSLTWMKDGKKQDVTVRAREMFEHFASPVLHVLGSDLKSEQRLRVLSGGRQLQISSAERTDAGSYTCTASSDSGTTSKDYRLQVYGIYVYNIKPSTSKSVLYIKKDEQITLYIDIPAYKLH